VEQLFYSDKYAWFSEVCERHYWFTCYILYTIQYNTMNISRAPWCLC